MQGSLSDCLRLPRVSYRALPSFHPGLCRSAALSGLVVVLAVFPQGFISGFALIPPWAMQECRPFRAHCRIGCVSPGFHIGLCPHFTLGFAGVSPFQGSLSDWACVPRVSYRTLPSFHPGLCRSVALSGLIARIGRLRCCVVVLCSLNVFGVCKWIVAFVFFVFDCDCIVCGI